MSTATTSRRAGIASTVISLVAAVLSSACCWAPLLALGLGTSAAGFAGAFAPLRPYFLGVAVLSLSVSAYLLFIKPRRAEACKEGSACATPRPKFRRFQVGMFGLSAVMVASFAFFPNYASAFLGDSGSAPVQASSEEPIVVWQIDGMTCKSCASILAESLSGLDGIHAAEVDYAASRAQLQLASSPPLGLTTEIKELLDANGFTGHELP